MFCFQFDYGDLQKDHVFTRTNKTIFKLKNCIFLKDDEKYEDPKES